MKFPFAAFFLALSVAGAYFYLSGGLLYLDQQALDSFALNSAKSPFGFVSYMFVHAGVLHLAGNLLPLVLFAFVLGLSLAPLEVIVIFLGAGAVSSVLFSLLNPSVALVGASAGVSGLIGAAVGVRPKAALPVLLISPFLFTFLALPIVQSLSFQQQSSVFGEANELTRQFDQFVYQNKTREAAAVNEKIVRAEEKKKVLEEGAKREASTPADFLVHLAGVAFGVAYVFVLHRKLFEKGAEELLGFLQSLPLLNSLGAGARPPVRRGRRRRPTKA